VQLQAQHGGGDFRVVGLTVANARSATDFTSRHGAAYPMYADARAQFAAMEIRYVPAVYLVDPDGTVVAEGLDAARKRIAKGIDA